MEKLRSRKEVVWMNCRLRSKEIVTNRMTVWSDPTEEDNLGNAQARRQVLVDCVPITLQVSENINKFPYYIPNY